MNYVCPCCDGEKKVHSHNDKCWSCGGSGYVSRIVAIKAIRSNIRLQPQFYTKIAEEYLVSGN